MKKLLAIIGTLLLLASCGEEYNSHHFSEQIKTSPYISVEAEIEAEFSDRVDKYRLRYDYFKGEEPKVTVLAPNSVCGIEATIGEEGTTVKFKDTVLETGFSANEAPTPLSVIHKLVNLWSYSETEQEGSAGDNLLFVFKDSDYEYQTTFSKDMIPLYAEVVGDSRLQMKIKFIKFEGVTNGN